METAKIGLTSILVLIGGVVWQAEARADGPVTVPGDLVHSHNAAFLLGATFHNGDWLVVDGLGMVIVFDPPLSSRCMAVTARGEVGIGGSAAAIGVATNAAGSSCAMDEFLGSGIITVEARVERNYRPSNWRSTEYMGPQVSLAIPWWWRPSVAWMFDVQDAASNHVQVGLGLGF